MIHDVLHWVVVGSLISGVKKRTASHSLGKWRRSEVPRAVLGAANPGTLGSGHHTGVSMTNRAYVTVPPEYHAKIREFIHHHPDGTCTIDTDSLKKLDELGIPWKIEDQGLIVRLLAELGASELARRTRDAETNQH